MGELPAIDEGLPERCGVVAVPGGLGGPLALKGDQALVDVVQAPPKLSDRLLPLGDRRQQVTPLAAAEAALSQPVMGIGKPAQLLALVATEPGLLLPQLRRAGLGCHAGAVLEQGRCLVDPGAQVHGRQRGRRGVGSRQMVERERLGAAAAKGADDDRHRVLRCLAEHLDLLGEGVLADDQVQPVLLAAAAHGRIAPFLIEVL
jgi:hypothetical protein